MKKLWHLGITGGIGSGKSTVAHLLAQHGATVIDADAISRQTTAVGGSAIKAIARTFGQEFIAPDGGLDRDRMRAHVFQTPASRKQLEAIIHPLVAQETQRQAELARAQGRSCLVFDIPLLVESGRWRARLDRVLVVDCREEVQIQRTVQRSGLSADAVQAIMTNQATRRQRLQAADLVLFNDGLDWEALEREVQQIAQRFGL